MKSMYKLFFTLGPVSVALGAVGCAQTGAGEGAPQIAQARSASGESIKLPTIEGREWVECSDGKAVSCRKDTIGKFSCFDGMGLLEDGQIYTIDTSKYGSDFCESRYFSKVVGILEDRDVQMASGDFEKILLLVDFLDIKPEPEMEVGRALARHGLMGEHGREIVDRQEAITDDTRITLQCWYAMMDTVAQDLVFDLGVSINGNRVSIHKRRQKEIGLCEDKLRKVNTLRYDLGIDVGKKAGNGLACCELLKFVMLGIGKNEENKVDSLEFTGRGNEDKIKQVGKGFYKCAKRITIRDFKYEGSSGENKTLNIQQAVGGFEKLEELDLSGCRLTNVSFDGLEKNETLKKLDIKEEPHYYIKINVQDILSRFSALEGLGLQWCGLTKESFDGLKENSTLKKLDIGLNFHLTEINIQKDILSRFSALEELGLQWCGLTKESFDGLKKNTTPKKLDIGLNDRTGVNIQDILSKFPELEEFKMGYCRVRVSKESLEFLAEKGTIKTLDLSGNAIEAKFEDIIHKLPKLEELNMRSCSINIDKKSLANIAENSILKNLNLSKNTIEVTT